MPRLPPRSQGRMKKGLNTGGIYKVSATRMYAGYFVYFCGCAALTRSALLFAALLVFQLAAHWIILSEERWCIGQFGEEYLDYMKRVRRYFLVRRAKAAAG